jgi:hypothetical protein
VEEHIAVVEPAAWPAETAESPELLEATLTNGAAHILLLPGHVPAAEALEVLRGERDGDDLPWDPPEWMATESGAWIRRTAIVSLRLIGGGPQTLAPPPSA